MADNKKKGINKEKKEDKKGEKREIVYVDINDIMEQAKEVIMQTRGGVDYSEIEYSGDVDKLKFTIPKIDRKGKCEEILLPNECEEGGCGETGGSCICGKPKGHEDDHECELCGETW